MGYAVLMVDGRGSANRGIDFEAHVKYALVNSFCYFILSSGFY